MSNGERTEYSVQLWMSVRVSELSNVPYGRVCRLPALMPVPAAPSSARIRTEHPSSQVSLLTSTAGCWRRGVWKHLWRPVAAASADNFISGVTLRGFLSLFTFGFRHFWLSLYHNCDSTTIRLRRKIDMFIFAGVESRRMELARAIRHI